MIMMMITIYRVSLPNKETHFSLPRAPPHHLPSDPSGSTMHRETPSGLSWMSQNHSNGMALGVFRCFFSTRNTSTSQHLASCWSHNCYKYSLNHFWRASCDSLSPSMFGWLAAGPSGAPKRLLRSPRSWKLTASRRLLPFT